MYFYELVCVCVYVNAHNAYVSVHISTYVCSSENVLVGVSSLFTSLSVFQRLNAGLQVCVVRAFPHQAASTA